MTAGAKTADIGRKYGVSENTFYKWRAKYAGMTDAERFLRKLQRTIP